MKYLTPTPEHLGQMTRNQQEWLLNGEHGISAATLFSYATGVPARDEGYPRDPADFRRCRLMLEACPELATCLPRVAVASPVWAKLVEHWNRICVTMDDETPEWRDPPRGTSSPKTYALMKDIIDKAEGRS